MSEEQQRRLAEEIARLESRLQAQGPICQLDRQRATPAALKADEGRLALLRRALRLLERGQALTALDAEARKAEAFLAPDSALASDPIWRAYYQGVLSALEDVRTHSP